MVTRRSALLGAGAAWSAPVILIAAAAPAVATSHTSGISTTLTLSRGDWGPEMQGVLSNPGPEIDVSVHLQLLCDSEGPGAGTTDSFGFVENGWAYISGSFVGTPTRGFRALFRRLIASGVSVPLPVVSLRVAHSVTGTGSAALSAPAPATVRQPDPVRWPAYSARRDAAKQAPITWDRVLGPPG